MITKTKQPILIAIVVIAILALLYGVWARHNNTNAANSMTNEVALNSGTVLPQPRDLKPFKLTDDNNQPLTNESLKNHWTFVFFGFTNCPSLCPTTLSTLNQTFNNLTAQHQQPMPQVLFISVDPDQDTPTVIRNYVQGFNPAFLGATGSKKAVDDLTQELNVMYAKVFPNGDKNYTIDHSGTILLLDPQGQLYAVFSTPHDANNIAKDFVSIVDNYHPKNA